MASTISGLYSSRGCKGDTTPRTSSWATSEEDDDDPPGLLAFPLGAPLEPATPEGGLDFESERANPGGPSSSDEMLITPSTISPA